MACNRCQIRPVMSPNQSVSVRCCSAFHNDVPQVALRNHSCTFSTYSYVYVYKRIFLFLDLL